MERFRFVSSPSSDKFRLSESQIHSFEQQFSLSLPPILREYYLEHNGAKISDIAFSFDDMEFYTYRILPLLGTGDTVEGALRQALKYGGIPPHLVPIADDMGNGLYYWDTRNEHVYFRYVDNAESYIFLCSNLERFFGILNDVYWRHDAVYDISDLRKKDLELAASGLRP